MKDNNINDVLVDLKTLQGTSNTQDIIKKEKSKYFVSFSSEYEIFEDVIGKKTYENDKELPISSLNNAFCAAVVLLLCSCAALSLSESEPQS